MEWFTLTSATRLVVFVPLVLVSVDIIRRIIQACVERKGHPFPPGPTPLPVVGSVFAINTDEPWLTYTEWGAKYGDIIYLRLLDSDVIVLNSTSVAIELLEKRSQIYSDRPFVATVDPYGHDFNFAFSRYGEHWRLCRRIFHQTFRANSALDFRVMQLRRARQAIVNITDEPDAYPSHFATLAASVAMSALYDYEPSPRNDPIVSIIDNFVRASMPALTPEKALLLKTFPFLLHIPDWLPGSWIRQQSKEARTWRDQMLGTTYQYVQKRMRSGGRVNAAMVSDHIARMEKFDDSYRQIYEVALKHASATAFIGSVETTSSTLMTFTLAMVKNRHVWKRAQAEIDTNIGCDRLPEFDDRPNLPYVDAIVRETLRWQPVGAGIVHAAMSSDVYRNYYIPKGATVIANIWAMTRDEARYPDAEKFIPERFLNSEGFLTEDNPADYVFGFGRRTCPGRHFADASVWSSIATMLATLEFNLAKNADGKDITFTATFASGVTHHPNPFPCSLTLRPRATKEALQRIISGIVD